MRFVSVSFVVAIFCSSLGVDLVACGSSSTANNPPADSGPAATDAGAGDGSVDEDSSVPDTALGALMPSVKRFNKNAVLATPKVVPITYNTDTNQSDIEAFYTAFGASDAFVAQASEYGVGTLTVSTPIHISDAAPATFSDSDLTAMLANNLSPTPADGGVSWGAPDPSTIYAFVFPAGTIVHDGTGAKCCSAFDGYHDQTSVNGVNISYSVVCACDGFDGPSVSTFGQVTVAASHETIEAVTDPFPQSDPAYADTDDAHAAWSYVTGGEVADMCELADTTFWTPSDLPYTIQRTWSNAAALLGHDPCVGAPMATYYQSVPTLPTSATVYGTTTKTLKIAVGATAPMTITVYGDASAGPFDVSVTDAFGGDYVGATVPAGPYNVGDVITAQVTFKSADPNLGDAATFMVTTTPTKNKKSRTYYFGFVAE